MAKAQLHGVVDEFHYDGGEVNFGEKRANSLPYLYPTSAARQGGDKTPKGHIMLLPYTRSIMMTVLALVFSQPCLAAIGQSQSSLDPFLEQLQRESMGTKAPKSHDPFMVLVSLSMPESSLIPLLRQAHELGAPVYIQGVLPEGFKATIETINQRLQAQGEQPIGGISIDPHPFKTWGVTRVPTYILQDQGRVDRLTGNITPRAALQQFVISGDNQDLARTLSKR